MSPEETNHAEDRLTQLVADVDHNIATLTGKGTFHGMGIVSVKSVNYVSTYRCIRRMKDRLKTKETEKLLSFKQ